MAKLHAKKLVPLIKRSRRYLTDPSDIRTMCAYLVLRKKVIKPRLAGTIRRLGRPSKNVSPVDQHHLTLREEPHRTFDTIGLAA